MKLPFGSFSKTDSPGHKVIKPLRRPESSRTVSLPPALQMIWSGMGWIYGVALGFVVFCMVVEVLFTMAHGIGLGRLVLPVNVLPTYLHDIYEATWDHYGLTNDLHG